MKDRWIPEGFARIASKQCDAVAYLGVSKHRDMPQVVAYRGKQVKPELNYVYKDRAAAIKRIEQFFADAVAIEARRKKVRDEAHAKRDAGHDLKVGDVLRCSWGYDQTNVDYYQVLKLVGKAMVEIQEIGAMSEENGFMSGVCVPALNSFKGEPMRKLVRNNAVRIHSFASAYKLEPKEVAPGVKVYAPSHWSSYA